MSDCSDFEDIIRSRATSGKDFAVNIVQICCGQEELYQPIIIVFNDLRRALLHFLLSLTFLPKFLTKVVEHVENWSTEKSDCSDYT